METQVLRDPLNSANECNAQLHSTTRSSRMTRRGNKRNNIGIALNTIPHLRKRRDNEGLAMSEEASQVSQSAPKDENELTVYEDDEDEADDGEFQQHHAGSSSAARHGHDDDDDDDGDDDDDDDEKGAQVEEDELAALKREAEEEAGEGGSGTVELGRGKRRRKDDNESQV